MFEQWSKRFSDLSLREKNLVLLSGAILILFVGFTYLVEPAYLDNQQAQLRIDNKKIELNSAKQQIALLQQALSDDPNVALQTRIDKLKQRIEKLDLTFAEQMKELVPAKQMPMVIDKMLQQADALTLLELKSIAPTNVFAGDSENADLPLYQHGVKLVFKGQYRDILAYLEQVEQLPWQLYWRSLDYQVDEYPAATITLELFTLNTNRAFIGVQ